MTFSRAAVAVLSSTLFCFAMTVPSHAALKSMREVMAVCDTNESMCLRDLSAGIGAFEDMGEACLPSGLTPDDAAPATLAWLRNRYANDSNFGNLDEYDGEGSAMAALYPCN